MPIGLVILSSNRFDQRSTTTYELRIRQGARSESHRRCRERLVDGFDENPRSGIAWWREAKFGCFIHWGVYSTYGGEWNGKPFRGYAEHMMRINKVPRAVYQGKRNFWRLLAAALSSSAASPSGLSSKRLGLADSSIETIKS